MHQGGGLAEKAHRFECVHHFAALPCLVPYGVVCDGVVDVCLHLLVLDLLGELVCWCGCVSFDMCLKHVLLTVQPLMAEMMRMLFF